MKNIYVKLRNLFYPTSKEHAEILKIIAESPKGMSVARARYKLNRRRSNA